MPEFSSSPKPGGGPQGGFVDIDMALLEEADLADSASGAPLKGDIGVL